MAVHPRVCGEQCSAAEFILSMNGSSPRMRGTGYIHLSACRVDRFIPAYAGNSVTMCYGGKRNTVHPRVCGEQCNDVLRRQKRYGSSPRMRGTGIFKVSTIYSDRFIPAYAGNRHSMINVIEV